MDPDREVPALLYIDRGGRVTMRVIGLTYWIPSLLREIRNRLILAIIQICLSWIFLSCLGLHVNRPPRPSWASYLTAPGPIAWIWSYIRMVRVPLAHISDSSPVGLNDKLAGSFSLWVYRRPL